MKTESHLLWTCLVLGLMHCAWAQPVITQQPQNQTNVVGATATFSVAATGIPPLGYQWRSHINTSAFTNIPFGTDTALVLTNVQPTARRFTVAITDSDGLSVTSSPLVSLSVPAITTQPTNQIVDEGSAVNFTVVVAGAAFVYRWQFNGEALADKTNSSLALVNVQLTNAGRYSVTISNVGGSITSQIAMLTVASTIHGFSKVAPVLGGGISLSLTGSTRLAFAPYYGLYVLEASPNLTDWTPLATLQRSNSDPGPLTYLDPAPTNFSKRFYRTDTNSLITPFPKPSGPYAVGTVSRLMTDPSRIRNTTPPTNSFMVTFWYPAEARAGVSPAAYVEKEITLVSTASGAPSYWNSPAVVAKFVSHALPDLRVATNQMRYPVLIFSHGMGGHRRQNTDTVVDLASHGYVVAAMDHKDAFASVFPSSEVVRGAPGTPCEALNSSVVDYRTHDLLFVMDELNRLNTNDPLLAGRLDLERLGTVGKSMGGMAVAEIGRIDARCKAVVLLDAGYTLEMPSDLLRLGIQKPFLSMSSTMDRPLCPNFGEWLSSSLTLFSNAVTHAFWFQIRASSHNGFSDKASLINDVTGTGNPTAASRDQSTPIRACTVSFFDKYLKGEDDHLLDNPAAVYTNIINFRRK